jgi:GDP-4-dehydro-6-deoxy-D-mannose reductase
VRILITGASGFVGRHLANQLAADDAELHGTTLEDDSSLATHAVTYHTLDLRDPAQVRGLIERVVPDRIYHLAAQSSPRRSFSTPWETIENNVRAQLNIFLACLAADIRPRILIVSSAEIYASRDEAIDEATPLLPTNPYGVSKITQDMLALQYHLSHDLPIMRARPFNHLGPGQATGFVAPDFALQIARIEAGQQSPIIAVGNLAAERDFTDVRDIVRAYQLILDRGTAGEVYNVASGMVYSIESLLTTLLELSDYAIEVQTDPARFMPVDVPVRRGDATRLRDATGWQPRIAFKQTLADLLDDCRQRVRLQVQ